MLDLLNGHSIVQNVDDATLCDKSQFYYIILLLQDFTKTSLHPVLIMSYEMFMRNIEIVKSVKFDLLVCDEGHRLKNANIKTALVIIKLL